MLTYARNIFDRLLHNYFEVAMLVGSIAQDKSNEPIAIKLVVDEY